MKKMLLVIATIFGSMTLMAQKPKEPILHNQFRDFVEFRKNEEKPKIEKKDGITLSDSYDDGFLFIPDEDLISLYEIIQERLMSKN